MKKIKNQEENEFEEPKGYTFIGQFSENAAKVLELKSLPVLMKDELYQEIENGEIGKYIKKNDYDAECLPIDWILGAVADYPNEVRDGGGEASFLCIREVKGWVDCGRIYSDLCYMLRIVPAQSEDGEEFWECIEVETNYNKRRNDAVLWQSDGTEWFEVLEAMKDVVIKNKKNYEKRK